MLESKFKTKLIEEIEEMLPGCEIRHNREKQGDPDLVVYHGDRYAMLEGKKTATSSKQPNQEWKVNHFKQMGAYASFIYPENKEEVLHELEQALQPRRSTRRTKR